MPATTVVQRGLPVSDVPVRGFGTTSDASKKQLFRDETVDERREWEQANMQFPDICSQISRFDPNQCCTRVKGHREHGGMHYAGTGDYISTAW